MDILFLLLPDFSLIALGLLVHRISGWGDEFWAGLEKLVYFLLFPALLFYSTARLKVDLGVTGGLVQTGMLALLGGIVLTWLGKPLLRATPMTYESGMQTAYRFNSYIALALATRMAGEEGAGLMAILLGFGVPLCNVAAVHALAARNGNLLRELISAHEVDCWLVNTGWTGGIYGVGRRMPIKVTRTLLTAALNGSLKNAKFRTDPYFGFSVPTQLTGVEPHLLYQQKTWQNKLEFDETARKLVDMFQKNFIQFEDHVEADVRAAAPEVRIAAE